MTEQDLKITPFEFGDRPQVEMMSPDFYTAMGEEGIRKMVSDHYDLLRKSKIKDLFPEEEQKFQEAKSFAADFFVQVCGGPKHYLQNRGRPMLIHRHAPFKITMEGRDEWLQCYRMVLPTLPIPEHLILSFWNYIDVFSVWMVNT